MGKILFDMDGTLVDWVGKATELLGEDYNKPAMKSARRLMKQARGFWFNLQPLRTGFDILAVARSLDLTCEINSKVAQSAPNCEKEKLNWCDKYVPDLRRNFSDTVEEKASTSGDVHVEDYPEHAMAWLDKNPNGKVILIDNPGNRDFSHSRVFRYSGPEHLYYVRSLLETI